MSRHSKNCTAHSVFTYAEKQKLLRDGSSGYNTAKARIGADSQKQFDQCNLCLARVPFGADDEKWSKLTAPVCCSDGHIFCKECIIENLVKQKKENDLNFKKEQISD